MSKLKCDVCKRVTELGLIPPNSKVYCKCGNELFTNKTTVIGADGIDYDQEKGVLTLHSNSVVISDSSSEINVQYVEWVP